MSARTHVTVCLALLWLAVPTSAAAQSTVGTISGRVVDDQALPLPGVLVSATSPNLQGSRDTVTSGNGDYILSLLPPGVYTVTYELSGFETQQRTVTLAPTQVVPLNVTMGLAGLAEAVEVVGRSADVLTQTAQVATNFSQDLIATLPTTRDINATLLLAPAVHSTGPSGNYSIAGSMSFESLFMINGVTVNENLRGQAFNLYIEDAIQETTVATAGISAEYGRFGGGVVNMITKSGGNRFSGSLRSTLNNDRWRALVPNRQGDVFSGETRTSRVDATVPTWEYTLGGPIVRDRLWFFTAGRLTTQEQARQLVATNIPYTFTDRSRRYEANSTYSLNASHRVQGTFIKETRDQLNNTFSTAASMDLRSLETRSTPQDLFTVNYSGILSPNFFVEARYSQRNFSFVGSGAPTTDLIEGTLLVDGTRRYWSPTFCGVCTDERRDNRDIFGKASYFLSTERLGSHSLTFGFDTFNDIRLANNHQSGSDYRIINAPAILQGTDIIASFVSGTSIIQWNPIALPSIGSDFRTHSLFLNDSWRISDRLTANLGLRWDKNDGRDQAGTLVADDSAISPRLGVVWDPNGAGDWSLTASFGRYVAAVANSIAGQASAAGNPQTWQYVYRGPDLNVDGVTMSTGEALGQLFAWFEEAGGCRPQDNDCRPNLPTNGAPTIPGVATRIGDSLTTPNNLEYAVGVNRQFGGRAAVRADYVFRDYRDFYVGRTDLSTGRVTNELGQIFDLTVIENTNLYKRRYSGLSTQGTYRFQGGSDLGVAYTIARTWGNVDGETVANGPITNAALQYPEYKEARWNYPDGNLATDQRHRARAWLNYVVPRVDGVTVSVLQTLESGVPYWPGGVPLTGTSQNGVDPRPYVANPGYVAPPSGTTTAYYFMGRDPFRTEGQRRTDMAVNYAFDLGRRRGSVNLFVQAQVLNVFNQFQRCGCGDSVFANGGSVTATRIDTTTRNNVTAAATYAPFNPFTQTPVQGVHWDLGPNFGGALNRFAYTTPRMFRFSVGARF